MAECQAYSVLNEPGAVSMSINSRVLSLRNRGQIRRFRDLRARSRGSVGWISGVMELDHISLLGLLEMWELI